MPPLAFTHLKYAAAERGAELKSMPPLAVASARILIGVPVARLPLPIPHLTAVLAEASLPTSESLVLPDDPPQADTAARIGSAVAAVSAARRYLLIVHLLHDHRQQWLVPRRGKAWRPWPRGSPWRRARRSRPRAA